MRNRNPLIALALVAVLGIIGVSFAYFTSTDSFPNVFKTKLYKMEVMETFQSPDDWTPGTTTDKTVIATNRGDIDAAVRVSYTESWKDGNGDDLPLKDNYDNTAAIINFASDLSTNWIESTENGVKYYYYKTKISKNQSTTSFINSVTFNGNISIDTDKNCVENSTNNTTTCTTMTSGYGGGTYTLNVKVETVQYDQYRNVWSTSVNIT